MARTRKDAGSPESGEAWPLSDTDGAPDEAAGGGAPEAEPEQPETEPEQPETGMVRIRNTGKAGRAIIVGEKTVRFDAEGIAEIDLQEAAILLGFGGYEEV